MFDNGVTKDCPYDASTVPDVTYLTAKPPKLQHAYLDVLYAAEKATYLAHADVLTKARLNATSAPEGRLIFVRFPARAEYRLNPSQFSYALTARAGVGVPDAFHPRLRECRCSEALEPHEVVTHVDRCQRMSGFRTYRHHNLVAA